jgi:hypothetical protein
VFGRVDCAVVLFFSVGWTSSRVPPTINSTIPAGFPPVYDELLLEGAPAQDIPCNFSLHPWFRSPCKAPIGSTMS